MVLGYSSSISFKASNTEIAGFPVIIKVANQKHTETNTHNKLMQWHTETPTANWAHIVKH